MIRQIIHHLDLVFFKNPVYFFHHIPKTGGTSVYNALGSWFDLQSDYFEPQDDIEVPPINLVMLSPKHCVVGHFGHKGYELHSRYPQVLNSFLSKYRFRCFTFIREPLEMRCSLYRHYQQHSDSAKEMSLKEHLEHVDNYTARILGVISGNYREVLDQYYYVGVADDLQASFDILAKRINKPPIELQKHNTTEKRPNEILESLSTDDIDDFRQRNKLDYEIYEYAQERQKADELRA